MSQWPLRSPSPVTSAATPRMRSQVWGDIHLPPQYDMMSRAVSGFLTTHALMSTPTSPIEAL